MIEELERQQRELNAQFKRQKAEMARKRAADQAIRAKNKEAYDQLMKTCNYWRGQYNSNHDPLDKEWQDRACKDAQVFLSKNPIR